MQESPESHKNRSILKPKRKRSSAEDASKAWSVREAQGKSVLGLIGKIGEILEEDSSDKLSENEILNLEAGRGCPLSKKDKERENTTS